MEIATDMENGIKEMVICVDGTHARLVQRMELTAGMMGVRVRFRFDESWKDLRRTVVFRCGNVQKDVLQVQELATIPAEVLQKAGRRLFVGIYGISEDGAVAVPTQWVDAGTVFAGADPSGDSSTDPSLPVWAQLMTRIGAMGTLSTGNKTSIVEAINEVFAMAHDGISSEIVQQAVDRFLEENGQNMVGVVSYAEAQALTEEQKTRARANIGALNREEVEMKEAEYIRAAAHTVAEKMLGITGQTAGVQTTGTAVNQLPLAIDTDGSIYNGIGYQKGHRLNSSGIAKEITESYYDAAVCVTGFIPCKAGDVLYFQGMEIDPADTQASSYNIHLYDSSFTSLAYMSWANASEYVTVGTDSGGCIVSLTMDKYANLENLAYIRLSARNITSGSAITINEQGDTGGATVETSAVPFQLAFLTDMHWAEGDKTRLEAAHKALQVIHRTATLDAVCFGGDYIHNWTELSADDAKAHIAGCRDTFSGLNAPAVWLRGNHENNGYMGQRLTRQEIFNRVARQQQTISGFVSNPADPYGCYGYLDFPNSRVRLLCVNTGDNDAMGLGETAAGNSAELINCHHIAAPQLQWIADKALNLSGKEDAEKWTVLVLSHIPVYSENSWYNAHSYTDAAGSTWQCNVVNLEKVAAAWRDGGSFSVTVNGETAAANFAGRKAGKILFVNGHGHCMDHINHNGFLYITCPNLCSNGEKAGFDGVVYTKEAVGTAGETAFTVLTVDSANGRVYAWVYGAGVDRELEF